MLLEQIQQRLQEHFEGCEIGVSLEGNHCHVDITGAVFEGLRPVKRQQLVYAALNDFIANGSVHAVHMNLRSVAEA